MVFAVILIVAAFVLSLYKIWDLARDAQDLRKTVRNLDEERGKALYKAQQAIERVSTLGVEKQDLEKYVQTLTTRCHDEEKHSISLQHELDELQLRYKELKKIHEKSVLDAKRALHSSATASRKIQEAFTLKEQAESDRDDALSRLQKNQEEIEQIQSEMKSASVHEHEHRTSLEASLLSLTAQNRDLVFQVEATQQSNTILTTEKQAAEQVISQMQDELVELKKEKASIESTMAMLQQNQSNFAAQLLQKEQEIASLQSLAQTKEQEKELAVTQQQLRFQESIKKIEEEKKQLMAAISSLENESNRLKADVTEHEKQTSLEIARLQSSLLHVEEEKKEIEALLQQQNDAIEKQKKEMLQMEKERQKMEEGNAACEASLKEKTNTIEQQKKEMDSLHRSINKTAEDFRRVEETLQTKIDEIAAMKKEKEQQSSTIQSSLHHALQEVNDIKASHELEKKEKSALETLLAEKEREIDSLQCSIKHLQVEKEASEAKLQAFKQGMDGMRAKFETAITPRSLDGLLTEKTEYLKEEMSNIEEERDILKKQVEEMSNIEEERDILKKQVEELQMTIEINGAAVIVENNSTQDGDGVEEHDASELVARLEEAELHVEKQLHAREQLENELAAATELMKVYEENIAGLKEKERKYSHEIKKKDALEQDVVLLTRQCDGLKDEVKKLKRTLTAVTVEREETPDVESDASELAASEKEDLKVKVAEYEVTVQRLRSLNTKLLKDLHAKKQSL